MFDHEFAQKKTPVTEGINKSETLIKNFLLEIGSEFIFAFWSFATFYHLFDRFFSVTTETFENEAIIKEMTKI